MTTSADLIARVRSNIAETEATIDPQRTDVELARWLNDGQLDYVSKIPADAVPELIEEATPTGSTWTRPDDFMKLLHIVVNHTLSGSTSLSEEATILAVDEVYLTLNYPTGYGAWAQFRKDVIAFGPNAFSATVRYIKVPEDISDPCAVFELDPEHEEPVVNYATAKALNKINDADSSKYMDFYANRVNAENGKYYVPFRVEKTAARAEPI